MKRIKATSKAFSLAKLGGGGRATTTKVINLILTALCLFISPTILQAQTHVKNFEELKTALETGGGVNIIVDADIDMSAQTGHLRKYFWGTLDGNGHIFSNQQYPLFACFGSNDATGKATIKNLGFYNADIEPNGTSTMIGVIADATAFYTTLDTTIRKQALIQNCWIKESKIVSKNANSYVGAFIGYIDASGVITQANATESRYSFKDNQCHDYTVAIPSIRFEDCQVHNVTIKCEGKHDNKRVGGFVGSIDKLTYKIHNARFFVRCILYDLTFDGISEANHHFYGNRASNTEVFCFFGHHEGDYDFINSHDLPCEWYKLGICTTSTIDPKQLVANVYDKTLDEIRPLHDIYKLTGNNASAKISRDVLLDQIGADSIATITRDVLLTDDDNPADYPVKGVRIAAGGSLIDNRTNPWTEGTVETKLKVAKWNLVGPTIKDRNLGEVFMHQNDGTYPTYNDIAVITFNTGSNDWNDKYLLKEDAMYPGFGYMVWPFAAKPLDGGPWGDNIVPAGGELTVSVKGQFFKDPAPALSTLPPYDGTQMVILNGESSGGAWWCALSNRYTGKMSAVQWLKSQNSSSNVTNVIYYPSYDGDNFEWKNTIEKYDTYIMPGQGFMVGFSTKGTKYLNMPRPKDYPLGTKKSSTENKLIKLIAKTEKTTSKAYAVYNESAANGFDNHDAFVLFNTDNENIVEPYLLTDGRYLLKDEFAQLPYITDINFRSFKPQEVALTVENDFDNIQVSIIDIEDGNKEIVLDNNDGVFTFFVDKGDNSGRYKVKFADKKVAVEDIQQVNTSIRLLQENRDVMIYGDNLQDIQVINALGQVVYERKLSGNNANITIDGCSGVYLLKIKNAQTTVTEKVIVK